MKLHPCLLLSLTVPLLAAAQTPTIWRCGSDGRSFSDTPCADGQVMALALDAPRPAADVLAAQARAAAEKQLADRLLHERLQREAAAQRLLRPLPAPAAVPLRPAQRLEVMRKRRAAEPADGGTFRAIGPTSRPTKG